jgi:hypothetical protein
VKAPSDPFLIDALGCSRFVRDVLRRYTKKGKDLDDAVYWAARWAFHWAQRSLAWQALHEEGIEP